MPFEDKTIKCRDCGTDFVFTAREQQFFADKGFTNAPVRCQACRVKRKQNPSGPGGGPSQSTGDRQLYTIICKKCGKDGKMATEPRDPKDVLCSDCFYEQFKAQQEQAKVK